MRKHEVAALVAVRLALIGLAVVLGIFSAGCRSRPKYTWHGLPEGIDVHCGADVNLTMTCIGTNSIVYTCVYNDDNVYCAPSVPARPEKE